MPADRFPRCLASREAEVVKPAIRLFVLFQRAVRGREFGHGQSAKFLNPHRGIMVFRRALYALLRVAPRGIGIDN